VLQCVAVCSRYCLPQVVHYSSVLQCSVWQCIAVCCGAVCCSVLQCVAVCCNVLQRVAVCCRTLQHTFTRFALSTRLNKSSAGFSILSALVKLTKDLYVLSAANGRPCLVCVCVYIYEHIWRNVFKSWKSSHLLACTCHAHTHKQTEYNAHKRTNTNGPPCMKNHESVMSHYLRVNHSLYLSLQVEPLGEYSL